MYGDPDPSRRRTTLFLLAGAIGFVALVVAAIALWPRRGVDTPEGVEAELQRSPWDREAAAALKANFPADYQELLRRVAAASRDGNRQTASRAAAAFLERFILSRANAVMAAPDRDMQRIAGGQLNLIRGLRDENVNLCAEYAMRGLGPGARLSPATLALLGRLSVYIIEAAHAGERPGRTPRPTLSPSDAASWIAAMRAIDSVAAGQIENDTAVGLPPAGQCRAGVVVYEAVSRLPTATAANVTAHMIRESLRAPPPGRQGP
jgi:hypothetical protein